MIRNLLREKLKEALNKAGYTDTNPEILATSDSKFGDYYSTIALKLKEKSSKQTVEAIAKFIEAKIAKDETFFTAEVAPNGFINFKISDSYLQSQVQKIIEEDEGYGRLNIGKGKKARVEFVSANPTGPLHIGNARGGPLGDTIASVLQSQGYEVLREYIHNDVGEQVKALGTTIKAKSQGNTTEENQYKGEYINELIGKIGSIEGKTDEEIGQMAVNLMYEEIMNDSASMGIKFDLVVKESELRKGA